MCKKLLCLTCLVLMLSMAGNASAQLLVHYKFDETSGNIATDSSGKGNDGIIGADPNWVTGWIDGALQFSETDANSVTLPARQMGMRSDTGTVAFWMYMTEVTGGINTIWWGGDNTTGGGWGPENEMHIAVETVVSNIWIGGELGFSGQNNPNFHVHTDPNKGEAGNEPNDPILLNDSQWHHITATWGNEDGNVKLYLEGVLLHETAYGTRNYPLSNMYLGQMANGSRVYTGLLDDVQIYGRALTAEEVAAVTEGSLALTYPASLPEPPNAGEDVARDADLGWLTGDTADTHNVYFGTVFADVNEATITDQRDVLLAENQEDTTYDLPGLLDFDQTYYWRVDEVEEDGTTIHRGSVWSFTVRNFLLVDDFEDYDDVNNVLYNVWEDYYVNNTGMTVGHLDLPVAEQAIFHSTTQSMPLHYDNDGTVNEGTSVETSGTLLYSEAERKWTDAQDCTRDGVESLTLWFRGYREHVGSFVEEPEGTYTMTASGADIWGGYDEFHFAFQEITTGKVAITAKIESLDNTDPFAKAGVMIRNTLEPGARNAGVFVTPENGTRFQRRSTADEAYLETLFVSDVNDPNWAPNWVRIERSYPGGLIRAYYSETGEDEDWESFTLQVISMQMPVYVGLAVTSHDPAAVCEAAFSNVSVMIDDVPSNQAWTHQDVGIISNEAEPMYVAVSDGTGEPAVVYHEDPNAALIDTWTEWAILLQEFEDQGVDLTKVKSLAIGFGDRDNPQLGGSGNMYFDDIRLYRHRCIPNTLTLWEADLNIDCVVDVGDLEIMAGQWLESGPDLTADISADSAVDFKDYAVLANQWLEE